MLRGASTFAFPQLTSTASHLPVLSTMLQPRRRISTVMSPTVFSKKDPTAVSDPGHIWWKTSALEQVKYGLPEFIGHSGSKTGSGKPTRVKGKLPDNDHPSVAGKPFDVPGIEKKAQPYMEDTHKNYTHEIDHGEMTPEHAKALKDFLPPLDYETSGKLRKNCVHVHAQAAVVLGAELPHVDDHLTPQGLFEQLRPFTINQH